MNLKLKKIYLLMLPMLLTLGLMSCSDDDDGMVEPDIEPTGSIVVDEEVMFENGTLTINSVTMSEPGWVVIHRDNNGSPMVPDIISIPEWVDADITSNVTVELAEDEEVEDGETLWVMLHTDDGVIGTYEFNGTNGLDAPIMDVGDNIITTSFMVSFGIEEMLMASDQDLVNGVVNVGHINIEEDGYVVIHASNAAGDGPMVPAIISEPVYLEAGEYMNVGVPLKDDANVEAGDMLWVMLHMDTGDEGVYEFDGSNGLDLPFTVGGNIVMTSITIDEVTTAPMSGAITVTNQAVVDNTITVENIDLDMNGWVVVHASNEAMDGPMVPQIISEPVYLQADQDNTDVVITFKDDANVAVGDTVYVMLHDDTGAEGIYEFDGMNGLDLPITDVDGVVVTAIEITE